MPDIFKTDQSLWYKVGVWGDLGYAVPNFGMGAQTQNATIQELVATMARNLSAIMHSADADVRTPPLVDTLTRIHKLIIRARQLITSRAVPSGQQQFQSMHASPGVLDQLIFPVPYFQVRNNWLKTYCGIVLNALAEAMQHQENARPNDITTDFGGLIGSYLTRIYTRMSVELLAIDPAKAAVSGFMLQDADFAAYNPSKFFTSTEMIDQTPPMGLFPTGQDLRVLTDGIPARLLVNLAKWPSGELYNPASLGNSEVAANMQPDKPGVANPNAPTDSPPANTGPGVSTDQAVVQAATTQTVAPFPAAPGA